MKPILSRQELRDLDRRALEEFGIPGLLLMENAGKGAAKIIADDMAGHGLQNVWIFCGKGNNGGDGFVIARLLREAGFAVEVKLVLPNTSSITEAEDKIKTGADAWANYLKIQNMKSNISLWRGGEVPGPFMLVDAIFGTGLSGELSGEFVSLIHALNSAKRKNGNRLAAIDIPSGMDADTGRPLGACVEADFTISFAAYKKGFSKAGAKRFTGQIYIVDIGIPKALYE